PNPHHPMPTINVMAMKPMVMARNHGYFSFANRNTLIMDCCPRVVRKRRGFYRELWVKARSFQSWPHCAAFPEQSVKEWWFVCGRSSNLLYFGSNYEEIPWPSMLGSTHWVRGSTPRRKS